MQPTRLQRLFRDGRLHLIGILNDYTDLRHLALHQTTPTHVLAAPVRWPEGFSLWRALTAEKASIHLTESTLDQTSS